MDYVQFTAAQRQEMLKAVGARSIEDLLAQVPADVRLQRPLNLPGPMDEMSLRAHLSELAGANRATDQAVCFLGAGAYDHFIPTVVDHIAAKGEFLTAYTPYQAEASQGALQAFFEFQTMICQITGMDVSNASLYDGATATAEAVMMAVNVSARRTILVSRGVHPHYRRVLQTYLDGMPLRYVEVPLKDGVTDTQALEGLMDGDTAAVVVASPNFLGYLEPVQTLAKFAHANEALCIACFNPASLGLLKQPGDMEADVAVGEGQPLGIPLQFGGPYLGLLAAKEKFLRKMPGRLVGQTLDVSGRRAFCLTLQTREQHIRRERATSNVCTNQGLLALRAAVYMAAIGPQGLRDVSKLCFDKAHYLAGRLSAAGVTQRYTAHPFFNEMLVRVRGPVQRVLAQARAAGILAGYDVGGDYPEYKDCLLVAVTEKRTKAQMDKLVEVLAS